MKNKTLLITAFDTIIAFTVDQSLIIIITAIYYQNDQLPPKS